MILDHLGAIRAILARNGERLDRIESKYPPAKPGALSCEPLKAA